MTSPADATGQPSPASEQPSTRLPAAPRPLRWRLISTLVAVIVTPLALAMMLTGVGRSGLAVGYQGAPADAVLILAGAALLGAVACTAFWSSLGVAVAGALALALGVAVQLIPAAGAARLVDAVDADRREAVLAWLSTGGPLLLGTLFLVAGAIASVARRRITRGRAVPLVR